MELAEFLEKIGQKKGIVDELVDLAYEKLEYDEWAKTDAPHGYAWHTSFHASRFPDPDSDRNCPRAAMYEMLNVPESEPTTRWLRGLGDSGKDIENQLVWRFHQMGWLLSPTPDSTLQLGAEDPDCWLSCSFDSVILPPGDNKPLPVEIKSKFVEKVREMILGQRGPDEKHVRQLKVQLAFCYLNAEKWWPELDPPDRGSLYYVARDDPSVTKEYIIELDMDYIARGTDLLAEWKQFFIDDELPHYSDKKHPLGEDWRWSELPCKWCPFKKDICKPDWKDGVKKLSESRANDFRQRIRGESNTFASTRENVLNRWSDS